MQRSASIPCAAHAVQRDELVELILVVIALPRDGLRTVKDK